MIFGPFLAHHETFTVAYMGWSGVKNGKLLDSAEGAGFDVLITGDKTLEYEQNLSHRSLALVALSARQLAADRSGRGEDHGCGGWRQTGNHHPRCLRNLQPSPNN